MATYSEKLKSPKWQKKRLEILQRDNFMCKNCGDEETELHVHHKKYIFGKEVYDYNNEDLITLCKECHYNITISKKNIKEMIDNHFDVNDYVYELESIIFLIKGLNPYDLMVVKNIIKDLKF